MFMQLPSLPASLLHDITNMHAVEVGAGHCMPTCSNAVSAACSCCASGLLALVMVGRPEAPLQSPMTVSLVLVSPSTVICKRQQQGLQHCNATACTRQCTKQLCEDGDPVVNAGTHASMSQARLGASLAVRPDEMLLQVT